ncbi:MAG TPA: thioredoxin domain-containing protein [Nocardioidaceae bacterium]|nr:thioredoxin domain-containing protein [Nocardioidaceae bacterium]
MANRLAGALSPYLRQHADNPVDWWPWCPEAFVEAGRRDVPVFLSVGYAACHWCHVMAHESFQDLATAAYLNEHFVSIKVDREERPDVDAVYMSATQAMTGQGGWPMTVMLTPEGKPFFCGTYFPPVTRGGMPGFRGVLEAVIAAWTERRDTLESIGADLVVHLNRATAPPGDPTAEPGAVAVPALRAQFDETYGGFGSAPKFPPAAVCEFLLRRAARTEDAVALEMAGRTLEGMARGGIFDQLGGGFARYSVDARWAVPHFEKMLYDNAQLLSVYVHWWRQGGGALAAHVVEQTADFLLRELVTPEGGLASSLDADSDGREGAYYVWSRAELHEAVGEADAPWAAGAFGLPNDPASAAGETTLRLVGEAPYADQARFEEVRRRLLAVRERRTRPGRDDKVVAAWNGMAIGALAEAGVLFDRPDWTAAAERAAGLLLDRHLQPAGGMLRVSRDGQVGPTLGLLEDYAAVARGLLTLFGTTGERRWYDAAVRLVEQTGRRFGDGDGGFFDTDVGAEPLVARPREVSDGATPSGQSMLAAALTQLWSLTGDDRYRASSAELLASLSGLAAAAPRFAGSVLAELEAHADGPRQVAVVGSPADPKLRALLRAAVSLPAPGLVVACGDGASAPVPLLDGRTLIAGSAAAYACRHFVCDLPVTDPAALH